jgi:hypothetical protein
VIYEHDIRCPKQEKIGILPVHRDYGRDDLVERKYKAGWGFMNLLTVVSTGIDYGTFFDST